MAHPSPPTARQLLAQGAAQAVGFVLGALAGRWAGQAMGFDAFGSTGYDNGAMFGIALIGLGGGAGVQLARLLYTRRFGPMGR